MDVTSPMRGATIVPVDLDGGAGYRVSMFAGHVSPAWRERIVPTYRGALRVAQRWMNGRAGVAMVGTEFRYAPPA
jgi:hypothetical protein